MATRHFVITIFALLLVSDVTLSAPPASSDVGLSPVQMIEHHNYEAETHYVTTEDGYILTVHRIPHGLNDEEVVKRPPVLLMHGLTSSSADYVNMGPGRSLGYLLADAGYDVWMGNSRGNYFSRNHTTLDVVADAEKFLDFSWHELGYYDLPAIIDNILEVSGEDSLYYVGHSQGSTQFLVLGSARPEYNAKIKLASLMAPASFFEHNTGGLSKTLSNYIYRIEPMLKKYQIFEMPFLDLVRHIATVACPEVDNYGVCQAMLSYLAGGDDPDEIEPEMIPTIGTNAPSNSSMKLYVHYGQNVKNGGFSYFDYGAEKNVELYGTEKPPAYDLSKISAPIAVYYGKNDETVQYLDVQTLIGKLPKVANDYLVSYDLFNHIDFVFAKDVVKLVYEELTRVMKQY